MLAFKRNWIFGGYKTQYDITLPLSPGMLSDIADRFLQQVRPSLNGTSNTGKLLDVKGRNRLDLLISDLPALEKDEVFRFGGQVATDASSHGFDWSSFDVHENSEFDSFEGAHHIVHRLAVSRLGSIPKWVPVHILGRLIPLKPSFFRFGVEHFRSNFISATFGYAPVVGESFLLDAIEEKVLVRLVVEERSHSFVDPFAKIVFFDKASEAILGVCGFDIRADYISRLKTFLR